MTGAIGQFQWIRSETNKAYLHALGVTLNYDDKSKASPKKPLSQSTDIKRVSSPSSMISSAPASPHLPSRPMSASPSGASQSTSGLRVMADKMDEGTREAKKEADQEMELDIDIARAYCELTEGNKQNEKREKENLMSIVETIRIFPDVKLNAMVIELSRLQRQAADYLDHLLDQREQLKMDAETYNDLISCIVGHAQRLHVNNKDASPAMVSKKKKANSGFTNIMRRKTTTTNVQSASMSGGVVGMKKQASTASQPTSAQLNNQNSRRSM
ncbi:hypothetical protein BD560DRAFT_103438 [Blakeslea trispora]|nr:hypothetical protein BD560DRAFT_103438 [Blakeslea trispora]